MNLLFRLPSRRTAEQRPAATDAGATFSRDCGRWFGGARVTPARSAGSGSRFACWLTVILVWGWGGTSQAIDPLPPDIEAAPEPVKLAYIERTARASEREKIEVGRRRYERRMERKRAMVAEIRQQAADRRQEIQSQVRDLAMLAENSAPAASSRVNPFMIFLVVTAAVLAIWYRYVFKPRETSC